MIRENSHLSDSEINQITKILIYQKQIILNSLREHNKFTVDLNELSNPIDATSINMDASTSFRFLNRETFYLKKIVNALVKISNGTHGICEECMSEIPFRRLQARPTAELCIECKEDFEFSESKSKKTVNSYGKTLSEI